ncbi:ATP-binding protein [Anaerosacchariphilus polymeriproducens]|uniref:ATP-binding protein n=1 Tax=Anaerosacchariphilus polymeriproducens TaxID=1812858 RepID=UPI00139018D0|nr:AAA family ATPase [Anaerosacchariphilus polymeriproducens]
MKIKKIEIENFGRFHKYSIDFIEGMNLIYGDNEDGKTTLMAFIKMMFYSEQKRSRDISNNPRKKYLPWNGRSMGGAIEFENNGVDYRIEKEMGPTPAKDKTKVMNLSTGEVTLPNKEELGKVFLGTDLAGFERSIFIGQIGAFDADKEDEIGQKLSNMFSTGEENISQRQVLERLSKAKEEIQSIRGNKGILVEAKDSLEKIKETKIKIKELEDSQMEYLEEFKLKKEELEEKKAQKRILEKKIKASELFHIQQKLKSLIQKVEEEQSIKKKLMEGGIPKDQLESFLKECKVLQNKIKSQETAIKCFQDNSDLSQKSFVEITEEEYVTFKKLREQLENFERGCAYFENSLIPAILDYNATKKHLREESLKKLKTKNQRLVLIGLSGSAALAIFGVLYHPAVILAGIVSALITVFFYLRHSKKYDEMGINNPILNRMEKSVDGQIQYLNKEFCFSYNLKMNENDFLDNLYQQIQEKKEKIKSIINLKHCNVSEEFETLYFDNLSIKDKKKTLFSMREEYQLDCTKYLDKVSLYKEVKSIEMADNLLKELENNVIELRERHQAILHMANGIDRKSIDLESMINEIQIIDKQLTQLNISFEEELENTSEMKRKINLKGGEITNLEEYLTRLREKIRIPEKNLGQIEVEQKFLESKVEEIQLYYDSLVKAENVMQESAEEIRKSFGPELNQKTGEIFSQITGGKYKQVLVAKDYSLLAQPAEDTHYREASYLSNGTIDQAYLALRLAITQLIIRENEKLPLFLDDIFMQYDDKRVQEGFAFFKDNIEKEKMQSQIMMLTCHKHIVEIAKEHFKDELNMIYL